MQETGIGPGDAVPGNVSQAAGRAAAPQPACHCQDSAAHLASVLLVAPAQQHLCLLHHRSPACHRNDPHHLRILHVSHTLLLMLLFGLTGDKVHIMYSLPCQALTNGRSAGFVLIVSSLPGMPAAAGAYWAIGTRNALISLSSVADLSNSSPIFCLSPLTCAKCSRCQRASRLCQILLSWLAWE